MNGKLDYFPTRYEPEHGTLYLGLEVTVRNKMRADSDIDYTYGFKGEDYFTLAYKLFDVGVRFVDRDGASSEAHWILMDYMRGGRKPRRKNLEPLMFAAISGWSWSMRHPDLEASCVRKMLVRTCVDDRFDDLYDIGRKIISHNLKLSPYDIQFLQFAGFRDAPSFYADRCVEAA